MKRRLLLLALLPVAALAASAVIIALPVPAHVAAPGPVAGLELQDRHGLPLRATRAGDGSRGGWIGLAEIDPDLLRAFIAAEDRRFYDHHGIDARAAVRAALANVRARDVVSGASTITMQTARLLLGLERGWLGKAKQVLWALRLEAHLDKSAILEIYLNRVPLGQGAVGVAAAASLYFAAPASNVSLGQAALLAGLARGPSRDNPFVDVERAAAVRARVLGRMTALGFALADDSARAVTEPVRTPRAARFAAPHFTTRLLLAADEARTAAPSATQPMASGVPATGAVRTTLDLVLQQEIEQEVRHAVAALHDRAARHAAAVVLDNRSGAILAWVGSPDFFADSAGQVDMVASLRQPGSTLKPFLYGLAFERGWTAATVLPDVPRTYATTTGPYRPQNYDRRFRGPVRIREALASSYNVPAVELTSMIGAGALLSVLRDAGFASLERTADHYGLGLALGNGEVTLLELANAYRGLASGGVWRPVRWLHDDAETSLRFTGDSDAADGRRFLSPGAAVLVLDVLSDPVARIPGFGIETALDFPFPAAAKTGTSRHFTDNWAVATTAGFTVAVWVGNFSGRPMQGVSGITGAGPLLYRAMLRTARRYAPGHLPTAETVGAEPVRICRLSGLRATTECATMVEWFLPGTAPVQSDDWEHNGRTTLPPEYAEWLATYAMAGLAPGAATLDRERADAQVHGERNARRILSPQHGDEYERPVGVAARYASLALTAHDDANVRWSVDGAPLELARWTLQAGTHWIRAEWPDGRADSVRIRVRTVDQK